MLCSRVEQKWECEKNWSGKCSVGRLEKLAVSCWLVWTMDVCPSFVHSREQYERAEIWVSSETMSVGRQA